MKFAVKYYNSHTLVLLFYSPCSPCTPHCITVLFSLYSPLYYSPCTLPVLFSLYSPLYYSPCTPHCIILPVLPTVLFSLYSHCTITSGLRPPASTKQAQSELTPFPQVHAFRTSFSRTRIYLSIASRGSFFHHPDHNSYPRLLTVRSH